MFYKKQPIIQRENYKKMLSIIGSLTELFSESDCPYISYRAHENIFCRYFEAENLARLDCSADAKKGRIGIGLKTWTGDGDQKVAEFGKLRSKLEGLSGLDLVRKVSEYRNERIRVTQRINGLDEMIYHILHRVPGAMEIIECGFDYIDIDAIHLIPERGNENNTYFTDNKHIYHFSSSKNTLYMLFEAGEPLDAFEVPILEDPYSYLLNLKEQINMNVVVTRKPQICLRLYSSKNDGTKFVAAKSGLNQWNAGGRARHPNEIYIPYPANDRKRAQDFFPGRDEIFQLKLPDGTIIDAKVCQQDCKAIMSNPNKVLGEWLLRNVFGLSEWTVLTYDMLLEFGIDCVIFTKHGEKRYSIDFAEVGTYERFYTQEQESAE